VKPEFESYVSSRYASLVTFAYAMTLDRANAEDVTQSALLAAYRRWAAIDDAEPYVRMSIARLVVRGRRRSLREVLVGSPIDSRAHDQLEAAEGREDVLRRLAALPPRQRAVLVLRYLDDQSDADIAAALDISLGTVRSQAARGLEKLRALPEFSSLEGPSHA
jgi:RNA polymerase sigma-70 factor (sigma-E family)